MNSVAKDDSSSEGQALPSEKDPFKVFCSKKKNRRRRDKKHGQSENGEPNPMAAVYASGPNMGPQPSQILNGMGMGPNFVSPGMNPQSVPMANGMWPNQGFGPMQQQFPPYMNYNPMMQYWRPPMPFHENQAQPPQSPNSSIAIAQLQLQLQECQSQLAQLTRTQQQVSSETTAPPPMNPMGNGSSVVQQQQAQNPNFGPAYPPGYGYYPPPNWGYPPNPYFPSQPPLMQQPSQPLMGSSFNNIQERPRHSKKDKKGKQARCKPAAEVFGSSSSSAEDSDDDTWRPTAEKISKSDSIKTQPNTDQNPGPSTSTFVNPNSEPLDETTKPISPIPEKENLVDMDQTESGSEIHAEIVVPAAAAAENPNPIEFQEAAKFYQAGKVNRVWQDHVEAEHLKEVQLQMSAVTTDVDKFSVRRGPETYVVGNKRKRKNPLEVRKEADEELKETEDQYATDSSVSSGGLSDTSRQRVKKLTAQKRALASTKPPEQDKLTGQKLLLEKMAEIDDVGLPYFVASKLREQNNKRHLFVRAFQIFGRERFINFFFKTLKVERAGGIETKNKERRRTPGGVFLYLIRNDDRLSQEDRNAVFDEDIEKIREEQRRDKEYQKRKMFESLTARMKENAENTEDTMKDGDEDDDTKDAKVDDTPTVEDQDACATFEYLHESQYSYTMTTIDDNLEVDEATNSMLLPVPPGFPAEPGRCTIDYSDLPGYEDSIVITFHPTEVK